MMQVRIHPYYSRYFSKCIQIFCVNSPLYHTIFPTKDWRNSQSSVFVFFTRTLFQPIFPAILEFRRHPTARKENAILPCGKYNSLDDTDHAAQQEQLKAMLGGIGEKVRIHKPFRCDNGKKIFIGNNFTGNYNLTILDFREVYIGDNVMIGPNTLISTVGHPLSPMGRRKHLGIAKPIHIGNDVWLGGNVTILPGVTIGNNVIVVAGAVVTRDVPDNTLVGGVPARKIKNLENDIP